MIRVIGVILLFFIQSINLFSASFRHLNIEDGLSSRQVFQVNKDSTGYVWMFTHLGVDRFDGSEFRHYKLDETVEAKDHILSSTIMTCDRNGKLWISLKNGNVFYYDSLTDRFIHHISLADHLSEPTYIYEIYFDRDNRLWLCLSTGLYQYEEKSDTLIPLTDFNNEHVTRIIQTEDGTFFVGTNSHLFRFTEKEIGAFTKPEQIGLPTEMRIESFFVYEDNLYIGTFSNSAFILNYKTNKINSLEHIIPGVPIRSMVSVENEIWIGTDGSGIYCLDNKSNQLLRRYLADEDNRNSLAGNTVADLMTDEFNCVWICTYTNGITLYDQHYPAINWTRHEHASTNSLISNHVNVIMEDSDGDIWYGTNNGVSLYQPSTNQWKHFLEDKGGSNDRSSVVLALCEDNQKRVWSGGYGIGIHRIDKQTGKTEEMPMHQEGSPNGFTSDYIYSIYKEGDHIWLGGIEGDFTRYNIRTHTYNYYPINCIGDIRRGSGNNLLLAGCDGLAFFNKTDGATRWFREFNSTILRYPIRCLIQASNEDIWLGTDGEGLIQYTPKTGQSRFFTLEDGITSNSVNGLVEDKNGDIWFTTEKNLYKVDKLADRIISMNEFIGVKWGRYNPNACLLKKNGNLAFGTAEGVIEFSPDFDVEPAESVKLLFTDFKLLYQSIQAGAEGSPLVKTINKTSSLRLKYAQNSFSLGFSSINFIYPHQVKYTYKLDDFDKDWRYAGSSNNVDYMNLTPGKYKFQLKAVHKYTQQVLGERSVEIIIGKPFWASFPAILLYLAIIGILVFLIVQYGRNKIAELNAREKIRFFINIAHDIRTPVTLIKAPLSELETEEELTERGRKSLSVATKNVDKLFTMVTQLLDLQKIDHNAEKIVVAPQDIYTYMQEKIIAFRMAALQKDIDLLLEVEPDIPEVWFDKSKMDIIMDNILSNAVKYTENGYISITIKHKGDEWSVTIQDTGIGIPVSDQKQLFKQFYRAGNAINSNESGTGIGLLLTEKLVKMHAGHINFSSVENKGSTFILTFPVKAKKLMLTEEASAEKVEASDASSFTPSGKEVLLLAEDNDDLREYLTDSLSLDYHVISVTNGAKALELAREINPDIIISDVVMPELRGDEMCRILKSAIETSHIPFILLSALSEKENVIMGLEAGANDYIIKPFDFSVLKARIRNILQSREQMRKTFLSDDKGLEDTDYANELDKEFLDNAIRTIEEELSNPEFSINDFCRKLGMSRTSVYNKIKTLTDQGPNDFIRIIRLNNAKELLKTKKYTIGEVSTMVGFSDPKYFSTSFKKQFGISPSKVN